MSRLGDVYARLRYSPFLCQLVVTRSCNLACGYCHEFDSSSQVVPKQRLLERIDGAARLGSLGLELTGGEPLLHPAIVDLVRHARTHRFHMLGMISNGLLLTDRTILELSDAGLTELQISIDAMEPNDVTKKSLRSLRPKLMSLARLARFKVVVSAVVGAGASAEEVAQVIRFAQDHGFRPRLLLIHDADGQLAQTPQERASYRALQRRIGWHYRDFFDYRERLMVEGEAPFRCRAGSRYLYVDEHGLARWCAQTTSLFGKPLDAYSGEDLRREFHRPKPCNARCTIGCARSCSMLDRWFPQRATPEKAPCG